MQKVDMKGHLNLPTSGMDYHVPQDRIIKDPIAENQYKVKLGTFNTLSFQKQHAFTITKDDLEKQLAKFKGRFIGEIYQQLVKRRSKTIEELRMIDPEFAAGFLLSYEIVEHPDSEVLELFGTVELTPTANDIVEKIPHYFSLRSLGLPREKDQLFFIGEIIAFDLEIVLPY